MEKENVTGFGNPETCATVSMKKLTEGIQTVFQGIVQMLSAMEAPARREVAEKMLQLDSVATAGQQDGPEERHNEPVDRPEKKASRKTSPEKKDRKNDIPDNQGSEPMTSDKKAPEKGIPAEAGSETAASEKMVPKETPASQEPAPVQTTLTIDDITKIIVRKVKQDRANSEKIGAILTSYGYKRVSDLPAEKYEQFLTDLSQL